MKVAMLLSGGVDSSVALSLLCEQGHDATAFYLKVWLEDELAHLGECPWEEDLRYARGVCEQLRVPLEVRSLQGPYWNHVVSYAVEELRAGRTPSPDLLCNQRIKFGAFLDSVEPGWDRVASGHYARVEEAAGGVLLKKAVDPVKDQTYFLALLDQRQVKRSLFPIGELRKTEVRSRARALGLPNKDRKDSQGICFLGKIPYREFVRHHLGEREGDVVDVGTGKVVGQHRGYWFHTIGQRQGLGLSHGPWFVRGKDVARNVVYVVHADKLLEEAVDRYEVENFNWIAGPPERRELQVRVRHGGELLDAGLALNGERGLVQLDRKDPGIAPGQFTVFYDGDVCLGGARVRHGG
ncbi:MAG TPA: tRNA 2-thiouridine(34) synthase MnmA [Vicinamibacteria bacterium]|nr:tRNA 2-thiouridine(34) synthase MnmA [Vicinamibacteria bacterium]